MPDTTGKLVDIMAGIHEAVGTDDHDRAVQIILELTEKEGLEALLHLSYHADYKLRHARVLAWADDPDNFDVGCLKITLARTLELASGLECIIATAYDIGVDLDLVFALDLALYLGRALGYLGNILDRVGEDVLDLDLGYIKNTADVIAEVLKIWNEE